MARKKPENLSPRIANRKAFHDYHISEKLEVGIVLMGSEVKSVRNSQVSLAEGFARVEPQTMELTLYNVNIAHYRQAGINQHDPIRPRKLLAHKRQIAKLHDLACSKGVTLVPLAMYFCRGMVKVEIGVGTGKKSHDKRQDLKRRDANKEIRKGLTRRII